MDRNREARRASIVGSNGFNRRRHRTNSLRDSPDDGGGVDLQESIRLRDRVKKERDRDRERDRERERERERDLRERSSRSKRRRAERLMNNRDDIGGDETSEESMNDDEDDEDDENTTTTAAVVPGVRVLTPPVGSVPNHHHHNHHHSHNSSLSQQQHNSNSTNIVSSNNHQNLHHRKSFPPPPPSKVLRAPPVWKSGDEMISATVPRKARSASTKRSFDWVSGASNNSGGGGAAAGGEQILRQASSSPVRQGLASTSTPSPAAPMSPSSSNASLRKKLRLGGNLSGGPKIKPPKASSKPSSSTPEEIEIAEVLYGLLTQSGPSSKKEDPREVNRSSSDAKSRVSSPISNSTSANNQIPGGNSIPLSAVAPKRKRPRQVPENSSFASLSSPVSTKPETDPTPKSEISSPGSEKLSGSMAENGFVTGGNPVIPPAQAVAESMKVEPGLKSVVEGLKESKDLVAKEEMISPKERESLAHGTEDSNRVDPTATATATMNKVHSMMSEVENPREEKFEIDLMAPPPVMRSSPEREEKVDLSSVAVDQKPALVDAELKSSMAKEREKEEEDVKIGKENLGKIAAAEQKKSKGTGEAVESSHKSNEDKGRNIDLQLDLEKPEKDGVNAAAINKVQQQVLKQQTPLKTEPFIEKSGQSTSSLPLPMSMAAWPGGLPPMGYMAPLQGVVSMDGTAVAPGPIQPPFSQPRPKRCATHCYIAKSIHYLQQLMKMNPFWPAAAGSASLFGSKPCNLNVMPGAADVLGNIAVRGVNNGQEKGPGLANLPNNGGKDKGSQPANTSDSSQRKQQILIQQPLPPVAPSNLLGPAFIFPLNQQQAAVGAAASARPGSGNSPAAPSNTSNSASASPSGPATAMSFNYPNMPSSETQYLAILQNNGYPFPIPAVGAPPNFRGSPAQAMPLFNGLYTSAMIHPSQLQHQQSSHQNASMSSGGSSSSQKHVQVQQQQQRPQGNGVNGSTGSGNLQNFPVQQSHNQHIHQSRSRHLDNELAGEDSPSTDSRGSRASVNIYSQNFPMPMPIHPQNFALITPQAMANISSASGNGNQNDKKTQPQHQQKAGAETLPHSFAMSFGPINGTSSPTIDLSTAMAQNHAYLQNFPEAARHNMQMMAAAAAAQASSPKKNTKISEDGKSGGGDSSATDDERKSLAGKSQGGGGQSIAFGRSEMMDAAVSSIQTNNVIDSSGRSPSVASGASRGSRPMATNSSGGVNVQNAHIHLQQQQLLQIKQQQQQLQQQQQQLAANAASRSKVPANGNGNVYPEHLSNSPMAAKFPSPLSGFPQNFVQSNSGSPSHSPVWKNSARTQPASQTPSSLTSSTITNLKGLPQQQSRAQSQLQTQISFGGNQKQANPQGQAPPGSNSSPTPPLMAGSPTAASMSKGSGGSPRTTIYASTNNKMVQSPSLSSHHTKNPPSVPNQKTPSILGTPPHVASSQSSGGKPQMQQHSQQQGVSNSMQQAQLFFSNQYLQAQSHSTSASSTNSVPSGYYLQQRRWPEQQPGIAMATSSNGVLTLCPAVTLSGSVTNDPAKAIAAATCNVKGGGGGGGLPSQGMIHAAQFAASQSAETLLPAGFPYVHPVPAAVPVKTAEQKQPAGNDNLHPWQPEKK